MRHVLVILFISSCTHLYSQQVNLFTQFKNLKPRAIGPSGMSGRITSIDALQTNTNIIYLGAASGGVWKTENAGANWLPIFDAQPTQNIGSVAVCQSNASLVWVGTGEGNPRNSVSLGEGIYKSVDAGNTFTCMGLQATKNIHRVIINPTNPNVVYAGAIGNPFAAHKERGVYKTIDGGLSWNNILHTNDTSGVSDMVMDAQNPNKLFVAMWQHSRTPWSFSSGGSGSGLFVTYDAGTTWQKLNGKGGLPEGIYGRIGITICHSMPNRVYALIESTKSALYKSDDGGNNWVKVNDDPQYTANRSFYFQDIYCDPKNENRLWLINQIVSMSEDAGKTFKTIIPYNGIHPDHHAFWINPQDPNFIIDGNDGGIGITRDKGKNWNFNDNLPVGQFYHINVDNELPYHLMGGMQDNGSWRGPAYTWIRGGIRNYYWDNLWGGDGFDVIADPADANWVYAMSQGGSLGRYNTNTGEKWDIKPPSTLQPNILRFNWNAALAVDAFDNNTLYFGSQFVHKSINKGASWQTISPDLTTNDSSKIDQAKNGGISIDITGAENHCTILAIEPSKLNKDILWVTTDDGQIQLTTNGGKNWSNLTNNIKDYTMGSWLPQVKASRYNPAEAFVVANDYRRGNHAATIYRTTNYGKSWVNILLNKNTKGYALSIIQDPTQPNLLFVGTEQGLWVSLDNANTFQQYKNNYPSVSTYDMVIQEREADLCIATFGRALYVLDDIRPLRALAANPTLLTKPLVAFPTNDAYKVTFKNTPGYEWSSWGLWDAENKKPAAAIHFYYNQQVKDSVIQKNNTKNNLVTKVKQDTLTVKIYNDNNQIVRTLRWAVDTGYQKKYWDMSEKGFRYPGSPKPTNPNADEPSGEMVLAGKYKAVLQINSHTDSTYIQVKNDPRNPNVDAILIAQKKAATQLQIKAERLTQGLDQLVDAEEIVKKQDALLKNITTPIADSILKEGKKILDQIKEITDYVKGKKVERQGYGQVPQQTVLVAYNEALDNILEKNVAPTAQDDVLIAKAETKIAAAVEKINKFFSSNWVSYQTLVEKNKVDIFKSFAPL